MCLRWNYYLLIMYYYIFNDLNIQNVIILTQRIRLVFRVYTIMKNTYNLNASQYRYDIIIIHIYIIFVN